jgi:cysteine-rich repeat protein
MSKYKSKKISQAELEHNHKYNTLLAALSLVTVLSLSYLLMTENSHYSSATITSDQYCGDGVVNGSETCDPPNTVTCDSNCESIIYPICGDGIVSSGEQCDDGNTRSGDGCSSTCRRERIWQVNPISTNKLR